MSLNKVQLIGNVGKDPEVRYLDSGVAVATFTLATTDRAYDQNGVKRYIVEIFGDNMEMLTPRSAQQGGQQFASQQQPAATPAQPIQQAPVQDEASDDLPF